MASATSATPAVVKAEPVGDGDGEASEAMKKEFSKLEEKMCDRLGTEKSEPSEVQPKNKFEEQMMGAAESGVVDPRSALGQRCAADCKKNAKLKDEYDACVGHAGRASFRASWASTQWRLVKEQRIEVAKQSFAEFSKGVYRPISVVWKKEGGDAEAWAATSTLVHKCAELGPPFIRVSSWTNRIEVLHCQRGP